VCINKLSYNEKEKYLDIEDFYFSGVTILGKNENGRKINPGMEGSNIKLSDFSEKNNSMFNKFSNDLTTIKDKLEELQNTYSNLNYRKEESAIMTNKDDSTIDTNKKTEETFNKSTNNADIGMLDVNKHTDDNTKSVDKKESEEMHSNKKRKFSVDINGKMKTFEISFEERISALFDLVNTVYGEADNVFYNVTCYENYLIMHNYYLNKHYKQGYSVSNGNYTLIGDRIEVYAEYVTYNEQSVLNEMRANYSSLVEYKNKNEAAKLRSEKKKILEDSKYSLLNNNKEYKNLVENMDKYSVGELEREIKVIFADYVTYMGHFSSDENIQDKTDIKTFRNVSKNEKKSRYGKIFSK